MGLLTTNLKSRPAKDLGTSCKLDNSELVHQHMKRRCYLFTFSFIFHMTVYIWRKLENVENTGKKFHLNTAICDYLMNCYTYIRIAASSC